MERAAFADVGDAAHAQALAQKCGVEEANEHDGNGEKKKQVPKCSEIGKD